MQKQSFANILQNRCSYKFPNIHKKISVLKPLFNAVRGLKDYNFNKKETPTQVFSFEYHKFFQNSFFMKYLQWLLLNMAEEFLIQARFVQKYSEIFRKFQQKPNSEMKINCHLMKTLNLKKSLNSEFSHYISQQETKNHLVG